MMPAIFLCDSIFAPHCQSRYAAPNTKRSFRASACSGRRSPTWRSPSNKQQFVFFFVSIAYFHFCTFPALSHISCLGQSVALLQQHSGQITIAFHSSFTIFLWRLAYGCHQTKRSYMSHRHVTRVPDTGTGRQYWLRAMHITSYMYIKKSLNISRNIKSQ